MLCNSVKAIHFNPYARTRCDVAASFSFSIFSSFNPYARTRCDGARLVERQSMTVFQPIRPYEMRPEMQLVGLLVEDLSTHTPVRDATGLVSSLRAMLLTFNPYARTRCDSSLYNRLYKSATFNPYARTRCDRLYAFVAFPVLTFNPYARTRCDLDEYAQIKPELCFQPIRPYEMRQVLPVHPARKPFLSTHPPVRDATT